ncbi:MAG: protein-export chaperone SecB [Gammaproteobacteria bacterium]|nr:protein-export chaperone SecB [Chromatiales bacterium]MDP6674873.1 protein-export chaperone SecB [Gammaproteobacteria bacterium]
MNKPAAETSGNGSATETAQFALQKIYISDLSFEAPSTPDIFINGEADQSAPEIQLNIKNSHADLPGDNCEVILHISVHATVKDRTLFMVELEQTGIFLIKGYPNEERQALLGTYCPSTLFPYAREAISSVIGKGGFPVMLLQPINFDALFTQAMQEQASQAS